MVMAIQTFGDVLGFNPHCCILVTDGCFYAKGMFRVAPPLDLKKREAILRHTVFCMLIPREKDFARNDRNADNVAAFRIPCTLRNLHPAERRKSNGASGAVHHLGLLFPGTDAEAGHICVAEPVIASVDPHPPYFVDLPNIVILLISSPDYTRKVVKYINTMSN